MPGPDDPLTPAEMAFTSLHETFLALQRGGFTRMEAILVIASVIVLNGQA
jgi:hypothetical protein